MIFRLVLSFAGLRGQGAHQIPTISCSTKDKTMEFRHSQWFRVQTATFQTFNWNPKMTSPQATDSSEMAKAQLQATQFMTGQGKLLTLVVCWFTVPKIFF